MTTEQRLERLERENRWMRRIGAVCLALVAAVFLMGQEKAKELPDLEVGSLKALVLYDGNLKARATLGVALDGEAGLLLYDGNLKARAMLGTAHDGTPGLKLFDPKGKVIWKAPKE
jgi:hypothetical protein